MNRHNLLNCRNLIKRYIRFRYTLHLAPLFQNNILHYYTLSSLKVSIFLIFQFGEGGGKGFVGGGVAVGVFGEGGGGEGEIGEFLEVVEFPGIGGGGVFGEFVGAQEGFMGGGFGAAEAMGLDGARGAVVGKGDDGARGNGAGDEGFCGRGEGRGVCRRRRRQNRSSGRGEETNP